MNNETAWTYAHLYAAEITTREICSSPEWRDGSLGERIVKQLCRELLLLESSDWQFLITTGAARDYAELRFNTHHDQFNDLRSLWLALQRDGSLNDEQLNRLAAIEERDNIFADIDPGLWSTGSHATHSTPNTNGSPKISPENHSEPAVEAPITDASVSEVHKYVLPIDHGAGDADDPA